MITTSRYTTAQIAPIHSGISFLWCLLRSTPFNPAFMNVGPSQRIMANVAAKASPLSAREAINGSPSPWNVLVRTTTHANDRARRLRVSVRESEVGEWECECECAVILFGLGFFVAVIKGRTEKPRRNRSSRKSGRRRIGGQNKTLMRSSFFVSLFSPYSQCLQLENTGRLSALGAMRRKKVYLREPPKRREKSQISRNGY